MRNTPAGLPRRENEVEIAVSVISLGEPVAKLLHSRANHRGEVRRTKFTSRTRKLCDRPEAGILIPSLWRRD